ncbi:hypothetical protein [Marinicellulosiphila megalodicopiae]|uniref:hypothetical protein n=1 Tax=Marinicellulosiphila megalodicopiae TaxID=2724896 RepID=UPI003BAF45B5
MQSIINKALPNVSKTTQTMQSNAGFLSILLLSVFSLSSCEDSLTDDASIDSTPAAVDLSRASAIVNQNNITIIAKSMIQSLNQINPALSDDVLKITASARSAKLDNCEFEGTQYSHITQHGGVSFDYDLEFLNCQNSANDDRFIGTLTADIVFTTPTQLDQYSIDVQSKLKQTNRYGEITVSHINSYIEVSGETSTQTFDLKVLQDGHGTFFVKNISALEQNNATQQWMSGHLLLTAANENIDIYVEQNEGLYFEFSDGTMQVVSWAEINTN